MAIQALSSVTNRGNSNISFEKRGEKPAKGSVSSVTSPLKAVPLAALIAMSPLNTTNAENIMRAENNANRIELAEAPQSEQRVTLGGEIFETENCGTVCVLQVNTKGKKDGFDKIVFSLPAGDFVFDAKELVENEIRFLSDDGRITTTQKYKEVIAEGDIRGEKTQVEFCDPNIVDYVERLAADPANQSNIKGIKKNYVNLTVRFDDENQLAIAWYLNENFEKLRESRKKRFNNRFILSQSMNAALKITEDDMLKSEGAVEIKDFERNVKGNDGTNYKLRFYDTDGNKDKCEIVYLQKDGELPVILNGLIVISNKIVRIDADIKIALLPYLMSPSISDVGLYPPLMMHDISIIDELLEALEDSGPLRTSDYFMIKVYDHGDLLNF